MEDVHVKTMLRMLQLFVCMLACGIASDSLSYYICGYFHSDLYFTQLLNTPILNKQKIKLTANPSFITETAHILVAWVDFVQSCDFTAQI